MGCAKLRLLLLASALVSTAACTTGGEGPGWWPAASELTPMERPRPALAMRVALSLPVESGDGTVARDRLIADEPAVPDIAGRWTGVWSGLGVMTRRVSTAQAEFTQAGRWGWGTIVLSDTLAADVPAVVTYRGVLGATVVFDVFPGRIVMEHEAGAVSVDREISDRRRGPAQRALGIATQPDLAEAHAERVVGEEAADQRFADPEQELDGLSRLNRSNHSWEHAQDAGLASGGDEPGRGRRRIEAAIAGALVGREDRRHALELEDRAVDVGLARQEARVVHQVARLEVVRAVDDQVVVADHLHDVVDGDARRQGDHVDVRVQGLQGARGRLDLRLPDVGRRVEDLPLKVRDVDDVAVHQRERPHAGRREVERGGRAEPTGADQQDLRAQELALALVPDLGQEEVAAVALDLIGRERSFLDHRHSRLDPLLVSALKVDDCRVAQVLQRFGG